MWIRSQDKERLINCDDIYCREINKDKTNTDLKSKDYGKTIKKTRDYNIYTRKNDQLTLLGKYKSKKRCLEVLDEIEKEINKNINISYYTDVYQMPKE